MQPQRDNSAMSAPANVLAVYLEPAPYIIGLVRELKRAWPGKLDVSFVSPSLTQQWSIPNEDAASFLPAPNARALREIWRRLRSRDYDLVHLAGWGHPVLLGAMLAGRAARIPVTIESDTPPPRGEPRWRALAKRLLYPTLFKLPARFLPGGRGPSEYLRKFGVGDERMAAAQMTVDVEAIASFVNTRGPSARSELRRDLKITDRASVFLFLGRLESVKGIHELFDAWIGLQGEDAVLLIAGSGSLERVVREAAAALRSVRYLGHLTGDDVWRAYASADVFVLPSRRDPWGLVVNEAMAAGLPVIVSDAVGCGDDLVVREVSGLVHRARDSRSLRDTMGALARDPERRRRMGVEGHRLISSWTLAEEARIVTQTWRQALS